MMGRTSILCTIWVILGVFLNGVAALRNITVNATTAGDLVDYTGHSERNRGSCDGRNFAFEDGEGFTFNFTGNGIWLYGTDGVSGAIVSVQVDNELPKFYDSWNETNGACHQLWFSAPSLSNGTHVLKVNRTGVNTAIDRDEPFMKWTDLVYSVPEASDLPPNPTGGDTPVSTVGTGTNAAVSDGSSKTPLGAIVGAAVGGLVLILAIVAAIWLIVRQRKKNAEKIVIVPYTEKPDSQATWVPPHMTENRNNDDSYHYYTPPPLLSNRSRPSSSSGGGRRDSVQSYHYVRNQSPRPDPTNSPSHHYVRATASPAPRNFSSPIPSIVPITRSDSPELNRSSPALFAGEQWDIFGGSNMVQGPLPSEPQSPTQASTPSVYSRSDSPELTPPTSSTAPMREEGNVNPFTPPKRSSARPLPEVPKPQK